jgi:hypothetical protein
LSPAPGDQGDPPEPDRGIPNDADELAAEVEAALVREEPSALFLRSGPVETCFVLRGQRGGEEGEQES